MIGDTGGLAADADGTLYAAFAANGGFYTVDKITGAATLIAVNGVDFGLAFAPQGKPPALLSYSVKFVCGVQDADELEVGMVRPGVYATEINIHNYHEVRVAVRKHLLPLVIEGKPRAGSRSTSASPRRTASCCRRTPPRWTTASGSPSCCTQGLRPSRCHS